MEVKMFEKNLFQSLVSVCGTIVASVLLIYVATAPFA
jgi:hypothetical protein